MRVSTYLMMVFILLCVLFLISFATAVGKADTCPESGGYIYNASGTFICVPKIDNVSVGDVVISAWMPRNDTVCITLEYLLKVGSAQVYVGVLSPSGTLLWNSTYVLTPDSPTEFINLSLGNAYNYTVLNASVNGYVLGPYAVPYTGVSSASSLIPRNYPVIVQVLLAITAVAPVVAVVLRYSLKAGGIAAMAISIIYVPIMHALGIPPPIPEFICAVVFIAGLFMVIAS